MTPESGRLMVVSNRLPIVLDHKPDGSWDVRPGSGGLVTALLPVLRNRGGIWIGWPGAEDGGESLDEALEAASQASGYDICGVDLTQEEVDLYYSGFCNEAIWPLFHDFPAQCNFDPEYWRAYRRVNRKFAETVAEAWKPGDYIWIHDYHLTALARELRDLDVDSKMGFFLHTPFPPLDIYLKLPWRLTVLEDLLQFDLLGFQTQRDRRNFLQCVEALLEDQVEVSREGRMVTLEVGGHTVDVGAFPISMDAKAFADKASSTEVEEVLASIRQEFAGRQIILGVDRLDYTKGLPERLKGYRSALERYPELHRKVTLVQIVVPSRKHVPDYARLKEEVERLVGEINGEYTQAGWVPIHYHFRSLRFEELLAYYRAAQIGLVTPLKDGMNLVAKEFCACSRELDSVLILSEFAGAAAQLHEGALMINPYDVEGIGDAILQAYQMTFDERRQQMEKLRRIVNRYDIFWWVDAFLKAGFQRSLEDFPVVEDYVPREEAQGGASKLPE